MSRSAVPRFVASTSAARLFAAALLVALSGGGPLHAEEAAHARAGATEDGKKAPPPPDRTERSEKPCKTRDTVVAVWNQLVAEGCKVAARDGMPPTAARLLRNIPFAMRGHPFESAELRDFFARKKDACGNRWYRPGKEKVTLPPGPERACARKIARIERTLRKRYPYPDAMERFLIENMGNDLLTLTDWFAGKAEGPVGSVSLKQGRWQVEVLESCPNGEQPDESGEPTCFEWFVRVSCEVDGTGCDISPAG
ncbi:MAG: YARHG domain-containing protein [Deltaproteobacteria bacterium]|nr:MAG: YARHG domain-containing protein [Deltaproteobacteria bacterium]